MIIMVILSEPGKPEIQKAIEYDPLSDTTNELSVRLVVGDKAAQGSIQIPFEALTLLMQQATREYFSCKLTVPDTHLVEPDGRPLS